LWEEYLERQRKTAQKGQTPESASQTDAISARSVRSGLAPIEDLLAELQGLQEDPEALKARAAEMAEEAKSSASAYSGRGGEMLQSLASDLETVASTGDLSVITEKLERKAGGARGGFGMPAHLPQIEEDSEEEDSESSESAASSIKAIIAQLQELLRDIEEDESDASPGLTPESILTELQELEDDPDALKARAAEIASALRESSGGSNGLFLEALASDLEEVASSGSLTSFQEKVEGGASRFARRSEKSAESGASVENSSEPASLESLFAKFKKLREENIAGSQDESAQTDEQSGIDELLSSIAYNLKNRLASAYSQDQSLFSSVSLSG
jgi:hypothetical protein